MLMMTLPPAGTIVMLPLNLFDISLALCISRSRNEHLGVVVVTIKPKFKDQI